MTLSIKLWLLLKIPTVLRDPKLKYYLKSQRLTSMFWATFNQLWASVGYGGLLFWATWLSRYTFTQSSQQCCSKDSKTTGQGADSTVEKGPEGAMRRLTARWLHAVHASSPTRAMLGVAFPEKEYSSTVTQPAARDASCWFKYSDPKFADLLWIRGLGLT